VVRVIKLWFRMFAFTDGETSAWTGREQVHLVRFDVDGFGVFAFADGPSREIIRGSFEVPNWHLKTANCDQLKIVEKAKGKGSA
jgi:hypothetical protein